MSKEDWPTKSLSITSLHLDTKNPRLGRETASRAPREIIEHLFKYYRTIEVAESIASRGFFKNYPLLAVKENNLYVVVEGNRRLAALKALREPGLLEGALQRQVERLARRIQDIQSIAFVPVTIAPNRRSTDRQIAAIHVASPVLGWQTENRASFILDKLEEGYTNDDLRDELGFKLSDIQSARQTRAIAEMARSLDLEEEVQAKLENPRANVISTLERVFESSVGREYLKVAPDPDHGLKGTTTKKEFVKAYKKLVTDIALGKQSSRTLNTNENIRDYFKSWKSDELPGNKRGSFVPADIIQGDSIASPARKADPPVVSVRPQSVSQTVLPKDLKIRFGNERLLDVRRELTKLKRKDYPNAGAVLLRVFFELTVMNYLERTGELSAIIARLGGRNKLPFGTPTMKQLAPEITRIAKEKLSEAEANKIEKAIKYDAAAPFTLSDLHSFVHQSSDLPGERDILQFWLRTEPLFRLMLEQDVEETNK